MKFQVKDLKKAKAFQKELSKIRFFEDKEWRYFFSPKEINEIPHADFHFTKDANKTILEAQGKLYKIKK